MTPTSIVSIPDLAPVDEPGACRFGGGVECAEPAEVQVLLPEIGGDRLLCRGHVGHFMLGSTSDQRLAQVLVRRLEPVAVEGSWRSRIGA